ncbi:MAG: AAA family ATPase [Terriglobales bacterium]
MIFKRLRIANWRQFRELDISFHERLTVLTGANGAGKTTVLNLLSRHFGWPGTLVSTPRRVSSGTTFSSDLWTDDYLKDYEEWLKERSLSKEEPPSPSLPVGPEQQIGSIEYGTGQTATLLIPPTVGPSFNINIANQLQLHGLHIPSHRPIYSYQPVANIPTIPTKRDQAFNTYRGIVMTRYQGGHHQHTPNYYMKETLISLAAFGYGNKVIDKNSESLAIFEGFEDVLRKVLPQSLGFISLSVRLPEVVFITHT